MASRNVNLDDINQDLHFEGCMQIFDIRNQPVRIPKLHAEYLEKQTHVRNNWSEKGLYVASKMITHEGATNHFDEEERLYTVSKFRHKPHRGSHRPEDIEATPAWFNGEFTNDCYVPAEATLKKMGVKDNVLVHLQDGNITGKCRPSSVLLGAIQCSKKLMRMMALEDYPGLRNHFKSRGIKTFDPKWFALLRRDRTLAADKKTILPVQVDDSQLEEYYEPLYQSESEDDESESEDDESESEDDSSESEREDGASDKSVVVFDDEEDDEYSAGSIQSNWAANASPPTVHQDNDASPVSIRKVQKDQFQALQDLKQSGNDRALARSKNLNKKVQIVDQETEAQLALIAKEQALIEKQAKKKMLLLDKDDTKIDKEGELEGEAHERFVEYGKHLIDKLTNDDENKELTAGDEEDGDDDASENVHPNTYNTPKQPPARNAKSTGGALRGRRKVKNSQVQFEASPPASRTTRKAAPKKTPAKQKRVTIQSGSKTAPPKKGKKAKTTMPPLHPGLMDKKAMEEQAVEDAIAASLMPTPATRKSSRSSGVKALAQVFENTNVRTVSENDNGGRANTSGGTVSENDNGGRANTSGGSPGVTALAQAFENLRI